MADTERQTESVSPETGHRKVVVDMRSAADDSAYETDGFLSVVPDEEADVEAEETGEVDENTIHKADTQNESQKKQQDDSVNDERRLSANAGSLDKDAEEDTYSVENERITTTPSPTRDGRDDLENSEPNLDNGEQKGGIENEEVGNDYKTDHVDDDEDVQDHDIITFQLGKVDQSKRFVLFFLTPSKQVVSLRNIQNGIKIVDLKSKLETMSGLPADSYEFVSAKHTYRDSTALVLGKNVAMGAVIRINLFAKWKPIYLAVERHDVDIMCKEGGVSLFGAGIRAVSGDDIHEQFQRRLFFALFLSAFKNEKKLCETLIELGADVNRRTDYDNTVLHVSAAQNHMPLIDFFLKKGAELLIHNKDQKTPIHIAQDIGSSTCERYMRLYNWSLTGKRIFPDMEKVNRSIERSDDDKYHQYYNQQYKYEFSERAVSASNRCKSAPARKVLNNQRDYPRTNSRFHNDCSRTLDFVTFNNVPDDMQYNTSVDYVQEMTGGNNMTVEAPQITETVPRKIVPYIDLAKSEENRTIIDMRKPRAKSAVVRVQHTPVYYNWYKDREVNIFQPRKPRCKSSKSTSDLDELRRQKNEAAFKAWVRKKEHEGAFDIQDEEDENRKRRYYSEEENERAFKEWLDGKKELLEQMGRRGPGQREPFKTKRERVQGVVQIGENEPRETIPDPHQYHTAYQRWLRENQNYELEDTNEYVAVEDLKRLVEDKRRRTVLNAKAYEEWLAEKREESLLRRRMKSSRNDVTPRPETFQKWIGMTATGDSTPQPQISPKPRPVSSKPPNFEPISRYSMRSMNSTNIPSNRGYKNKLDPPAAENGEGKYKTNIFDDFLFATEWKKLNSQPTDNGPSNDQRERAVRFKPLPR